MMKASRAGTYSPVPSWCLSLQYPAVWYIGGAHWMLIECVNK